MSIACLPCKFWERLFWYAEDHMIWELGQTVCKFEDILIGALLCVLWEIWLGPCLRCKIQEISPGLLGVWSYYSSISTLFQVSLFKWRDWYVSPGCMRQLTFLGLLSLFQDVDLVATSARAGFPTCFLCPGFFVCRLSQYNMNLNLISWFFVFSWFRADWITECSFGLAGARGCWLKGLHQMPIESWLFHHPYNSIFIRLSL